MADAIPLPLPPVTRGTCVAVKVIALCIGNYSISIIKTKM